jgi:hypothetical protein
MNNLKSESNPNEMITNLDLEMAGMLLLLLLNVEEMVCNLKEVTLQQQHAQSKPSHTSGITPFNSCSMSHCSTGIMAQDTLMLSVNANPHKGDSNALIVPTSHHNPLEVFLDSISKLTTISVTSSIPRSHYLN